jgi:hypothetical protein
LEADGCVVVTPYVSSGGPDPKDQPRPIPSVAVIDAGGRVVVTQPVTSDRPDPGDQQRAVPPVAVIEAGGRVVVTPPVPSDEPDLEVQSEGAQLDSLDVHAPEEVEPTEQDRRSAAFVGPEKKSWRRKKLSARKDVQDLIKDKDPASC